MGALSGDPDRLAAALAQIAWTLSPLVPGPIQVQVNGEPLPGAPRSIRRAGYAHFLPPTLSGASPDGFFMRDGALHRLKPETHPVVEGAPGQPGKGFTSPAVSGTAAHAKVAALGAQGGLFTADMAQGSRWEQWISGAPGTLTPPSWDPYEVVWTAENAASGLRVWAAQGSPAERVVIPEDMASARVSALRVSRDGARVAMIVDRGNGPEVQVGAIVRGGALVGGRFDQLETLVEPKKDQQILDIAWKDGQNLVVLSGSKNGKVYTGYAIGDGRAEAPKSAANATTISALNDSIVAGDKISGEVQSWDGKKNEWKTEIKSGAATPVYPG
jgi:hypothetical protein